jgi:DNA-binding GntR family transcriptional regulator
MELNNLVTEELKKHRTAPNLVAAALRKAILRGELKAGQVLRQEELAAVFGVSRIPLREAFRKLEAEGLITLYPHKGAVVTALSAAEAQELYEIRWVLETTALKFAMPNYTATDFQKAERILQATDTETDPVRWSELNRDFHLTLYTPSKRPRLLALLENLHHSVDRYMRFEFITMDYRPHSQAEHYQILQACQNKDLATATALLSTHIEKAGKLLVAYLGDGG